MQIYRNSFPPKTKSAVALGNFDGVHKGHTELIKTLVSFGLPTVVYTFDKHPLNYIKGEGTVLTVNTNSEKAEIFGSLGADSVIFADFESVRNMSASDFVDRILIGELSAVEVVCGFNYRFGKNCEGDAALLGELLAAHGARLTVIDEVQIDGTAVSSTQVRAALMSGDMERAAILLGRPYFIDSTVVHGRALGRQMGFPTLNETFADGRMVLPYGVYFAKCTAENQSHIAVVNVGVRPTVTDGNVEPTVEAHIIDYDGDLYGSVVRIEFIKKWREEQKFNSLDDLRAQISRDVQACRRYFNER